MQLVFVTNPVRPTGSQPRPRRRIVFNSACSGWCWEIAG